jgi:hypothetical protein
LTSFQTILDPTFSFLSEVRTNTPLEVPCRPSWKQEAVARDLGAWIPAKISSCPCRYSVESWSEQVRKLGSEGPCSVDNGSTHIGCSCSAEQYTADSDNEQCVPKASSYSRNAASQGIRLPYTDTWTHAEAKEASAAYDGLSAIQNRSVCYSTSRLKDGVMAACSQVTVAKKKSAFQHYSNGTEPTNTAWLLLG